MKKLSPLDHLIELEKDARDFGFEWPKSEMIIDQIMSECEEVLSALKSKNEEDIKDEIGDLIHSTVSLVRFLGYDIYEIIEASSIKFSKRMEIVKSLAKKEGFDSLKTQSLEYKTQLWQEAKKIDIKP